MPILGAVKLLQRKICINLLLTVPRPAVVLTLSAYVKITGGIIGPQLLGALEGTQ